MKYIYFLLLLTIGYAQEKQRYVIYTIDREPERIAFQHIQVPTIGTSKQVPIKLDTWTGETWILDATYRKEKDSNIIEWKWVKIETQLPPK